MDYETATDSLLNKKLSEAMAWKHEKGIKSVKYDSNQNCFWIENVGFQSYPISDYCNNWNDIMPIVILLGVDLVSFSSPDGSFDYYVTHVLFGQESFPADNGIQRALTICCLKVLIANQAPS